MTKIETSLGYCKILASCNIVPVEYARSVSSVKYVWLITDFNSICGGTNFSCSTVSCVLVNTIQKEMQMDME